MLSATSDSRQAVDSDPSLHCTSSKKNSITLCTEEEDGVMVNGINLIQTIKNLTAELEALKASILPECTTNAGRRMLQTDPCFTSFPTNVPTENPSIAFALTQVGGVLVADRASPDGEDWTQEDLNRLEREGIDQISEACTLSQEQINMIFDQASKQLRFRALFPSCRSAPGLTPEEIVAIVFGVVGALASVVSCVLYFLNNRKKASKEDLLMALPIKG